MEVPEACGAWAAMAAALVVVMHLVFRASSPRSRPASCLADDEVYGNVGSNVGCLELLHQSILVMGSDGPPPHPLMAVSCVCWKENTPRSSMMRPSLCLPVSASVLPSILQSDRAIAHPPRRVPAPLQILYFVQTPGNIGTEDRESSGRVSPTQTQRARRRSTRRTGQAADPTKENLSDDGLFSACVTGGTGFLGGAIVRQMAASGRFGRIVVIDLRSPAADSPNRVAGVEYRVGDLCAAPRSVDDPLTAAFLGVDVVVHTAGRVVLYDDPHALYNAHVVATRHVIRAARRAGVRALLLTSSAGAVTTPYTLASQIDLPSDFQPPSNHHFPSHYATTKYRAERDAIAASTPAFPVCALRAPGIYGIQADGSGDPLMVGPLLSGQITHMPAAAGAAIDFCYLENAAHAHVIAATALLTRPHDVAGRTFNVSNGEPFHGVIDNWNQMIAVVRGEDANAKLRPLPYVVAYVAACASEGIYAFTAGRVPLPRAAFWQLTRSTLALAMTPITLKNDPTLGYVPPFDNVASFHDIKRRWKRGGAKAQPQLQPNSELNVCRNPLDDVDWGTSASMPSALGLLDTLAGPNPSPWELGVTSAALAGGCLAAYVSAQPGWSAQQQATSALFAVVNASAAVQCATAQSKRWYHAGGCMRLQTIGVCIVEMVLQQVLLWYTFAPSDEWVQSAAVSCVWFVACAVAVVEVPLHVQRPVGVLLTLASIALSHSETLGRPIIGMEWFTVVFPVKYLISHLLRHEPYRE